MNRFVRASAAFGALLLSVAAASAQSSDPAWLDKLSDQLATEQGCAVDYYVNIQEGDLAGRKTTGKLLLIP